jgi:23S rRNA (guanosine2251-2'-O)-methyltransferase
MPRRKPNRSPARKNSHYDDQPVLHNLDESSLVEYLEALQQPPFVLALDRVQDPHNLGACLRSANAAGCHLVIAPRDRTVGLTETARRVACGGADTLPYVRVTNLGRTLDELKAAGLWLVGTGDEESQPLYDVPLTGPLCLIMGAEGTGIRAKTASKCDHLVSIPMSGTVECLNVSVATGVCLFEAVRQRL